MPGAHELICCVREDAVDSEGARFGQDERPLMHGFADRQWHGWRALAADDECAQPDPVENRARGLAADEVDGRSCRCPDGSGKRHREEVGQVPFVPSEPVTVPAYPFLGAGRGGMDNQYFGDG
jgi:hypothetical protein